MILYVSSADIPLESKTKTEQHRIGAWTISWENEDAQ